MKSQAPGQGGSSPSCAIATARASSGAPQSSFVPEVSGRSDVHDQIQRGMAYEQELTNRRNLANQRGQGGQVVHIDGVRYETDGPSARRARSVTGDTDQRGGVK